MYLGSGNKEAGKVYIYTLNGVTKQWHLKHAITTIFNNLVIILLSLVSLFLQEGKFISNGTLKSDNKSQDARFGYALAAAPDLNHDGFTDLVVGAPLEDEHRGAIYVYHGYDIYIIHDCKQVVMLGTLQCKCKPLFKNTESDQQFPRT